MNAKRFFVSFILLTAAAVMILPVLMTVFFSFFAPGDIADMMGTANQYGDAWMTATVDLRMFSLSQYRTVLASGASFWAYYRNSLLYTIAILICQSIVIPGLAYALGRFQFPGRDLLFLSVILLLLLPFQVTMVPMVLVLRRMGLLDTVWAMILPSIASPLYIFLLRQHMINLPNAPFEALQMDGGGTFRCFLHIALPMSKPILIAVMVLSFTDCWNMVEQPLVFLPSRSDLHPLSVVFGQMTRQSRGIEFAGAVLYILPSVILYRVFQKQTDALIIF